MKLSMDSMMVPFSRVIGAVRWTGEDRVMTPMDGEGNLDPRYQFPVGIHNPKGRAVWLDNNRYIPHQGARECARRQRHVNSSKD